jgi:hypothetical protein
MYAIVKAKPIQRAQVRGGGRYWKPELADDQVLYEQTITEWQVVPALGTHKTRIEAMRHYVNNMEPDMPPDAPDSHIRRHWKSISRAFRVKLVRVDSN